MKKPIFIIFNDVHLKPGNEDETLLSVRHMIQYAIENQIKTVVFAGDMFHSRSNQRESVLNTFDTILEEINLAGLHFVFFPGNHDKTDYKSYTSFLKGYRHFPNITFTDRYKIIDIEGVSVGLMPFFDDSMLVPMLDEAEGADILISHFEMKGSAHLGQVSEKGTITRKTLSKWSKTYLGHYHNTHEITKNIIHLPSLRQQDFGEDDNKGFSVIFDDLSYLIISGVFKRFNKVVVDVDKVSLSELKQLVAKYKQSIDTVRFELVGSESKLKSIDQDIFKDSNIDIKKKFEKTYLNEDVEAPKLIKKFDTKSVVNSFKDFCEEKQIDYEEGNIYLQKFLNKKNE